MQYLDAIALVLVSPGGVQGATHVLEVQSAGLPPPSVPVLVYSDNPQNTEDLLLMRNASKVWWIGRDGSTAGSTLYTGDRSFYTGCEYWGTASRLAHSFTNYTYAKKDNVRHMHWSTSPGTGPYESYTMGYQNFVPISCASAERQDLYDDELLLLLKCTAGSYCAPYVYWTMESEH